MTEEKDLNTKTFSFKDQSTTLLIQDSIDVYEIEDVLDNVDMRTNEDNAIKKHIESSDKKLEPINTFSEEEKEKLEKIIETKAKSTENGIYTIPFDDVAHAVETILAEQKDNISPTFYRNVNPSEEFGIERFVLDRVYHLPNLIKDIELLHLGGIKYIAQSEKKDSSGNSIKFEHRFQSTSEEEAKALFNNIASRQAGIWQKIWLSCWLLGNKKGQFTYTCHITEIMHTAYPQRDGYFSVGEKSEFYENLKSIEQTRFVLSKSIKKTQRKKYPIISYNIPLVSITQEIRAKEGDRYPEQLTISLRPFEPEPREESIYHVGAAIKNKTLELHADDTQLATWIQTRKHQMQNANFIQLEINSLFELAGLGRTAKSNKGHAKKLLKNKLTRLVEQGIIISFPEKFTISVQLQIR